MDRAGVDILIFIFPRKDTSEPTLSTIDQGSQVESYVSSPLMVKALAMRMALFKTRTVGISKICIYSDCQLHLRAVASHNASGEIFGIL
ncbi:unnamed protein product [Arabis nemorensis]|uniref:RNase H type-1 domain-containing protein n=1 Tax=Arabis nemorensis TaxID=586526 RepID=A0A565B5N3_9BRAS|nr:unnamed protein product [Arabis nemorensis]